MKKLAIAIAACAATLAAAETINLAQPVVVRYDIHALQVPEGIPIPSDDAPATVMVQLVSTNAPANMRAGPWGMMPLRVTISKAEIALQAGIDTNAPTWDTAYQALGERALRLRARQVLVQKVRAAM